MEEIEIYYVNPNDITLNNGQRIKHEEWLSKNFTDLGLELIVDPSDNDIRKAYHKLSIKYHPDKPGGSQDEFIKLKTAFDNIYVEGKMRGKLTREMRSAAADRADRARRDADADADPFMRTDKKDRGAKPGFTLDDMWGSEFTAPAAKKDTGGTTAEEAAVASEKRDMEEARELLEAAAVASKAAVVAAEKAIAAAEEAEGVAREARERATEARAAAEAAEGLSDEINDLIDKQYNGNITLDEKTRLTGLISEIMEGQGGGGKKRKYKRKKSKKRKSRRTRRR